MKILITTDAYFPTVNGVVRSTLNLKQYLENNGHEVKVLTLSNSLKSYTTKDVYYVGSLSAKKIYPDARINNILSNTHLMAIRSWEPDIIHSQSEFSTFVMAKILGKLLNIPMIHTYHTLYEDYTHYITRYKKAGVKVVAVASKAISEMCNYIIAPTEKTARVLRKYNIDEDKIVIIPTGIHIPEIYQENLNEELGIPKDTKNLLYLGRIAEEKNIEEIMNFYEKLKTSDIRLYIVGGGPHLDKLKDYSKKCDKDINFVGMVDPSEVNKYYQVADVFVTASVSETQGLTYYEALSNGTVAVCREDESLTGVIVDGYNGYKYNSFEQFSDYINQILSDENIKKEMEKNARDYAIENFSVESFGKKCEDLYKKALSEYDYESSFIFKRL